LLNWLITPLLTKRETVNVSGRLEWPLPEGNDSSVVHFSSIYSMDGHSSYWIYLIDGGPVAPVTRSNYTVMSSTPTRFLPGCLQGRWSSCSARVCSPFETGISDCLEIVDVVGCWPAAPQFLACNVCLSCNDELPEHEDDEHNSIQETGRVDQEIEVRAIRAFLG